jgi:hypothetical protein
MNPKVFPLAGLLVSGMVAGIFEVILLGSTAFTWILKNVIPMLAEVIFTFVWLHHDGKQILYRRSLSMNVAIVLLPFIFVPVYLYRSRRPGDRGMALGRFVGFCLLLVAAMLVGVLSAGAKI